MARIEVPMPQMGESIAEGTVSKWLKQIGEEVERDEPILEISTDKVDAEVPAPDAGTLVEVAVQEGQTVEVGTIVAYIDTEGDGAGVAAAASAEPETAAAEGEAGAPAEAPAREPAAAETEAGSAEGPGAGEAPSRDGRGGEAESAEERLRRKSTPVVRRMAQEHGVDLSQVPGTGHAGRVTKQDLVQFLETKEEAPAAAEAPAERPAEKAPAGVMDAGDLWERFYGEVSHPQFPVREGDRVETMDKVRRLTAEHMVLAKRVAPHVHSFIEIDFSRVDRIRRQNKKRWEEQGARVSFTTFVAWACARLLREHPQLNATISGNNIIYRNNVNVGMAVDLNPGLIVPVIRDADDLSLVGLARKMVDLADRARARQLGPDEIQGATFSITNPGVLGTVVGMPIIPKGTSGILGTGAIEKKVVVVEDDETGEDTMAIRKRSMFSLGYDHRLVDGADAARFLADLKEWLEDFPEEV